MVDAIVSFLREAWPTGMLAFGIAAPFIWLFSKREIDALPGYLALYIVCTTAGLAGISLKAGAVFGGGFAFMFGLLAVAMFRGWWYDKRFPVFGTEPKWRFTDENGQRRDLYIAEIESGFIIGMMYEVEIDDAMTQQRTRWKDRFNTYQQAKDELRCRAASYGLTAETPLWDDTDGVQAI